MSPGPTPAIYLFAKSPVAGAVKTRMQPALSAGACADLAATMCSDICATLSRHWPGKRILKAAPDTTHPLFLSLAGRHGFELEAQRGADLGERMMEALSGGIRKRGAAAVIGADVPQVSPDIVQRAFDGLCRGRNLVGPASDGGFYFLGLQRAPRDLFKGIHWGGETVLERLRLSADALGIQLDDLPELRDVDRIGDLRWLGRQDRAYRRFLAPEPIGDRDPTDD